MNPPAGFWRRYAAYSLDGLAVVLLALPLLVPQLGAGIAALEVDIARLQVRIWELFDADIAASAGAPADPFSLALAWADDPQLHRGMLELVATLTTSVLVLAGIVFAAAALWFIGFEGSRWQATPGKRLLGLQVTGLDGGRPPWWRIALRFVAGVPSWLLLHLGHAMTGWNREKRALHDFIAGTRVLLADGAAADLPRWALAWLFLQAALCFGLVGHVLLEYARMLLAISDAFP